jgi:hypothetical protein
MQADPAGNFVADPTNPQSWNMYTYAWNNPLAYVDPTGLDVDQIGGCYFNVIHDPEGGPDQYTLAYCVQPIQQQSGSSASPPPPPSSSPTNNKVLSCFAKGVGHGAVGAIAFAGVTAVAGLVAAPEVVTAGLFVAGVAGTAMLARSIATHSSTGNNAGLAYDAGSALGGILGGGATAFGVRASISGETNLPTSFADFLGMGMGKTIEFNRPGQSIFGALRAAFAKGPDLGGAGLGVAAGGAGAAAQTGCN